MDDSFSVRVDRVFGSLSSSPSKPLTSSLWSLTDEEIEKKEWSRDTETPDDVDGNGASLPTDVDGFFANRKSVADEKQQSRGFGLKELEDDLQSLDDEAKESGAVERRRNRDPDVAGDEVETEEWEIRNSIGMDCTLDYEDEEDKYDKVAVGDEERGDRIYMREVNDYGIHVSSFDELPTSFREVCKDPRANHLAAKLRLKEDEEAAKNLSSSHVSAEIKTSTHSSFDKKNHPKSDEMSIVAQPDQNNASDVGTQVKSILKRKELTGSTSGKRVRFVSGCKENDDKDGVAMLSLSNGDESRSLQRDSSAVPDHVRNPSKYICYTFDETNDMDEKSNQQGFMDFLNIVRKSKQSESADEPPADLSQRVIFNPKRKGRDNSVENSGNRMEQDKEATEQDLTRKKNLTASIVSEEAEESDVCAMDEDPPQMEANRINSRKRTTRQYRSKIIEESDV